MRISDWSSDVCSSDLRIDCIAVLPAAATSITANSTAMRSEGMECDAVAMSAPSFSLFVTRLLPTRGRPSVQSQDRLFPCATVTILPRHCHPQQRESHHDQYAGAGPRNERPARSEETSVGKKCVKNGQLGRGTEMK